MKRSLLLLSLATLAFTNAALAQITTPEPRIQPRPNGPVVKVSLTQIRTTIRDGVATTELRQTLRNDGSGNAEADWLLPLPKGAPTDRFTMIVGGKEMPAEVLDANRARQVYEEIVRRQRDPGLLEYMGQGLLRARVFPIPAQGQIEVRVRYQQLLPETDGLHGWSFPLRATGVRGAPTEKLSLDLKIHSTKPLKNIWSPIDSIEIVRKSDHEASASMELDGDTLPDRDLELFYGLSPQAFGLDLLTWRNGQGDGHFLLMLSPKQDWPEGESTPRLIQFVLDTSGSMQGQKIEQARKALAFFLGSLRRQDNFNVVPFSTEARPFFPAAVPANAENIAAAHQRIAAIEARGGTNIEEALSWALQHSGPITPEAGGPGRDLQITVFLTDGMPTVGQTDGARLAAAVKEKNLGASRIFVFGVGNDVNTRLLDRIAQGSRGDRDYVREHEDIEVKTGALFTKLSHPVLTDLSLHFDGIEIPDQQPARLTDLFKGSRLVVLGRYRGAGHKAIRLSGMIEGRRREFIYEANFAEDDRRHDFVPALWAQRKVAVLLDAIRLNGGNAELIAEVQRLGREYGIVTPYTSHLIVEEGMQLAQSRGLRDQTFFVGDAVAEQQAFDDLRRSGRLPAGAATPSVTAAGLGNEAESARVALDTLDKAEVSGDHAVTRSVKVRAMAEGKLDRDRGAAGLIAQRVGGRVLLLVGGVWVDRAFEASMQGEERKVEAFSDAYFALLDQHPELAKVLAFSSRLVLVVDGEAIEILPPRE